MTAQQAQLNLLAGEIPHENEFDLKTKLFDLRNLMKVHEYSSMRNLVEEVWKVCPDAFPKALTATSMRRVLMRHTIVLLHEIIHPRHRFNWDWYNYFDWDHWDHV